MRDNFHKVVNNTWYSILFDHKLTKLFCIEIFCCKAFWEGSYYNYNIVFNYYYKLKVENEIEKAHFETSLLIFCWLIRWLVW